MTLLDGTVVSFRPLTAEALGKFRGYAGGTPGPEIDLGIPKEFDCEHCGAHNVLTDEEHRKVVERARRDLDERFAAAFRHNQGRARGRW